MKFKEAVSDTNKALKEVFTHNFIFELKLGIQFIKQEMRDLWRGLKND